MAPLLVDEVVLVGGCTKMPCVPRLLKAVFWGKDIFRTTTPDEAVAHGAALLAAHLSGESTNSLLDGILEQDEALRLRTGRDFTAGGYSLRILRIYSVVRINSPFTFRIRQNRQNLTYVNSFLPFILCYKI